jgi:hypothetical protein
MWCRDANTSLDCRSCSAWPVGANLLIILPFSDTSMLVGSQIRRLPSFYRSAHTSLPDDSALTATTTNDPIHSVVKASGLRPRDVSPPPVGSSTLPGRFRVRAVPSVTFFNCIQVSRSCCAPGSGSRFARGGRPGWMPMSSVPVQVHSFKFFQWFLAPAHKDYPLIRNHYSPSSLGLRTGHASTRPP